MPSQSVNFKRDVLVERSQGKVDEPTLAVNVVYWKLGCEQTCVLDSEDLCENLSEQVLRSRAMGLAVVQNLLDLVTRMSRGSQTRSRLAAHVRLVIAGDLVHETADQDKRRTAAILPTVHCLDTYRDCVHRAGVRHGPLTLSGAAARLRLPLKSEAGANAA